MPAQPNILFILVDDLGWRDVGCYGSDFYETPNLDRLAGEGMRFTQAYASCPVCSPTRASIMSGKNPARVGVTQFIGGHSVGKLCDVPYFHELPMSEISLATALREGGYRTWHLGKWHLGDHLTWPHNHGFDVNLGGCGWGMPNHGYFSPYHLPTLSDGPDGEYMTDRLTDEAIRLIEGNDGAPFFLNFWPYAVHTPIQAPAALVAKYTAKAKALGLDQVPAIVEGEYFPCQHMRTQRIQRRVVQSDPAYAAMIENLDTNVGRLLATLEARGVADNTLVIFTSDNGGESSSGGSPTCNLPLKEGKGWMHEGGTRVSQLMRWPGHIPAGSTCGVPVISTDYYPTLLEAAGLPARPAQHVDGTSLRPLFSGGTLAPRALCWHYPHYSNQGDSPACAIREGDWKLIEHFEDHRLELFNLRDDPYERHNVAAAHPIRTAALHAQLVDWREEVEALLPPPNPNYMPPPLPAGVDAAEV